MPAEKRVIRLDARVGRDLRGETIPDEGQETPDEHLERDSLKGELEAILGTLTEREQEVVKFEFGLEGGMTVEELQSRFGLSREGVRRIKRKALRKLRDSEDLDKLMGYLEES